MDDRTTGQIMWLILAAFIGFGPGATAACAALWASKRAAGAEPEGSTPNG